MSSVEVPSVSIDAAKLLANLVRDLTVPNDVAALQSSIDFEGGMPILPIPHKSQATSAALLGLLGIASARLLQIRNGSNAAPRTTINTSQATILLYSVALGRLGKYQFGSDEFAAHLPSTNEEPETYLTYHTTNVYKCKDGRYFHMHGSLAPTPALEVIGLKSEIPGVNNRKEAYDLIQATCLKYTAEELRDLYSSAGLVGDILLTPEEYDSSEQGKLLNSLPLAKWIPVPGDTIPAPYHLPPLGFSHSKPLEGVRVLEFSRIIAGPIGGRLLAELGATVVRVIDKNLADFGPLQPDSNLDKRPIFINARSPEGQAQLEHLLETADIFLQGYRPGVMDRLGLSHEHLQTIGARRGKPFVIIDESAYGGVLENGPDSLRPGYQQVADSVTGIAWQTGRACGKDSPLIPPAPISDYCTGMLCAAMAVLGLVRRETHTDTVFTSLSLAGVDLWIRKQEQYPAEWVRETYRAGPQFDHTWHFIEMLRALIKDEVVHHPEYFQPHFFATLPTTPSTFAPPGAAPGELGPSFTHLAPIVIIEGVASGYTSTATWGQFRPGWDEEDADVLEKKVQGSKETI